MLCSLLVSSHSPSPVVPRIVPCLYPRNTCVPPAVSRISKDAYPVPAARTISRASPTMSADLATAYITSLHEHYFATTAVQALVLVAAGDALAQQIELRGDEERRYDPVRTVRMGLLGCVIGGFGTARWLQFLEAALPLREAEVSSWSAFEALPMWTYAPALRAAQDANLDLTLTGDAYFVVVKALLDACIWAPIANTLYLILTPLSEGKSVETVRGILKEQFVPVMKTEIATFFPYNLISFSLVPPLVRPFTTGFVSMCFAVFISWITHLDPAVAAHKDGSSDTVTDSQWPPELTPMGDSNVLPFSPNLIRGREIVMVSDDEATAASYGETTKPAASIGLERSGAAPSSVRDA